MKYVASMAFSLVLLWDVDVQGDLLSVNPSSDRVGDDVDHDGSFDFLFAQGHVFVGNGGEPRLHLSDGLLAGVERRFAMEFDIEVIPPRSTVHSATLFVNIVGTGNEPSVAIHGYTGNHVVELTDLTAFNPVAGPITGRLPEVVDDFASVDVTSWVQSEVNVGAESTGFMFRTIAYETEALFDSSETSAADTHPRLTIEFTPIPEPYAAGYIASGLLLSLVYPWCRRRPPRSPAVQRKSRTRPGRERPC